MFYEGNLKLLKETMIGVVGSRKMSNYASYCVHLLSVYLRPKYGIISGVAKGVDAYAHFCAIKQHRATIGVIGCGLNIVYPKENKELYKILKEQYLLLSEYPKDVAPLAHHFPWRNRIIASLSEKLVVVEAQMKSGTMITVGEALELGKDVYAFPHAINNEMGVGCNFLISQGCGMLNNSTEIAEL